MGIDENDVAGRYRAPGSPDHKMFMFGSVELRHEEQ